MGEPTFVPSKALPFVIALQKFVEAVEVMERVVMFPSKLIDMVAVSSSADAEAAPRLLRSSPELSLLDWFNTVQAFREYVLHGRRLSRGLAAIKTTLGCCCNGGDEVEVDRGGSLEGLCAHTSALAAQLQLLADCATYLTRKYQESLGDRTWLCASEAGIDSLMELNSATVTWLRCHNE